jgi:hypothetical protein
MEDLKMAGLCLVSMIVMAMALAGNASATPLFVICREGSGLTKYSTDNCTTAESAGKWQAQELTTTEKGFGVNFTLTLTDTKTALGVTKIRCDTGGESTGVVGPENIAVGETAKIKNAKENCRGLEGGCESNKIEEVKAVDSPWKTTLFETEKKIFGKAEADGGGEPGWAITCKTVLGSKTDTCIAESPSQAEVGLAENKLSGGVLLILGTPLKRGKQKCTEGGKEAGEIEGQGAGLLLSGLSISVSSH